MTLMQGFGWKVKGKRTLERSKRRCQVNNRKDYIEIIWEAIDWIQLAQYNKWQVLRKKSDISSVFYKTKRGISSLKTF